MDNVSIFLDRGVVIDIDGAEYPIANYIDNEGNDCEPIGTTVVVASVDVYWLAVEVLEEVEAN